MKYKMIVSDFDGTLADWEGKVSVENITAIKDYINAGGKFAICTGRMYQSIVKQLKKVGLDNLDVPIMSFQGSLITDASGKEIYSVAMDNAVVLDMLEYAKKHNKYIQMYTSKNLLISKHCECSDLYAKMTNVAECIKEVGDLKEYLSNNMGTKIIKVLMIDKPENLDKLTSDVNEYLNGKAVFNHSAKFLTEAVAPLSGKGNAIKWCGEKLGVSINDIMGVGDSMNDYTMLVDCGMGVAMGESCDKLKSVANYITGTVEENGLAQVIKKVINKTL